MFTNLGNCYKLYADKCACRFSDGGHALSSLFEDVPKGERPVAVFPAEGNEGNLLFITKRGLLKCTAWSEYALAKTSFQAIRLGEGDEVLAVETDRSGDGITVFFVSRGCMCLNARKDDIPVQGRVAGGVRGMNLRDGDEVIFAAQIDGEGEIVVATRSGKFKRVIAAQVDELNRNCKGVRIADKQDEIVFADYVTNPYMLAVETEDGMLEISTESIPIDATSSRGRALKGAKWTPKAVYAMKYRPAEE